MTSDNNQDPASRHLDPGGVDNPLELAKRAAYVVDQHHAGHTFTEIGAELGISRQRVHQIYWDAVEAVPAKSVAAVRAAHAEQLAEVIRVANEVMAAQHLAHSNGRVVTLKDEDGNDVPVLDDGPKLDAGRTIIAAQGRWAKLIGADAPTQVAQDVSVNYTVGGGVDPAKDLT